MNESKKCLRKAQIMQACNRMWNESTCKEIAELLEQILTEPARWIPIDEEPHEDYECSNCEYIISMYIDMDPHIEYRYCPSCGRKMEGTT